jgi:hypothetical protein
MIAVADLDGDGNSDVLTASSDGALTLWRNAGDARHRSLRVQLTGRVGNQMGVGAKVEARAGSLRERIETAASTPAVTPADIVFGLGARSGADVVRVLWPSGILQSELAAAAPGSPLRGVLPARVTVAELDRKPSSCPFLFTWNGQRFEFVTDFMGGGEMGAWEQPGVNNRPVPLEYVRIRGDQLQIKDGRYEIRVTNELEETLFVDQLQLVAITHPSAIDVYPNEGLTDPPKPFRLFALTNVRPPARAVDDRGHDVTPLLAKRDGQYVDDFDLRLIRGYSVPHALTLDLGAVSGPAALILTGWTDYAFSSDNVAARQAGFEMTPAELQIQESAGRWRTVVADIGIPVGRPQAIVVDLTDRLRPGEHQVRIVTSLRIYWDQIAVATPVTTDDLRMSRLDPIAADLHERGFSAEIAPAKHDPLLYDYARVSRASPWKAMTGRYTRQGDVRPLITRADDMFVITKPGDEIALSFDASRLPALPAGWTRTFLLEANGFSKEMDINSASPDRVEPLPFHRMSRYPYAAPEHYPDAPAYQRYRARYNTRVVGRSIPSLDAGR